MSLRGLALVVVSLAAAVAAYHWTDELKLMLILCVVGWLVSRPVVWVWRAVFGGGASLLGLIVAALGLGCLFGGDDGDG